MRGDCTYIHTYMHTYIHIRTCIHTYIQCMSLQLLCYLHDTITTSRSWKSSLSSRSTPRSCVLNDIPLEARSLCGAISKSPNTDTKIACAHTSREDRGALLIQHRALMHVNVQSCPPWSTLPAQHVYRTNRLGRECRMSAFRHTFVCSMMRSSMTRSS